MSWDLNEQKEWVVPQQKDLTNQPKVQSPYLNQYLSWFGYENIQAFHKKRAETLDSIANSNLIQVTEDFQPDMLIKLKHHTPNYEFLKIQVEYGNFIFKNITIANFNNDSWAHLSSECFSGGFCNVWKVMVHRYDVAFKCLYFPEKERLMSEAKLLERVQLGELEEVKYRGSLSYTTKEMGIFYPDDDITRHHVLKKVKGLLYNGTIQQFNELYQDDQYTFLSYKREILLFNWKFRYPPLFPQITNILNRNQQYQEDIADYPNI